MASAGEIDREKAKQVAQQIMADVATAMHSAMTFIGDRLGLFKAMRTPDRSRSSNSPPRPGSTSATCRSG